MKNYGKVIEYNGIYGNVKGVDGVDYLLLKKNVIDSNIKALDDVEFESEFFKTTETEANIARFVKVLRKEKDR